MASRNITWKTVTLEDIPNLSHEELLALSDARKREKLFSRADSPTRLPAQRSSGPSRTLSKPAHPSVGSSGPVRTTRSSQKPSPYTRMERSPSSLNVDRSTRTERNAPVQTRKAINEPSPPSSPEPEEGSGRRVTASLNSVKDTIEMMRVCQRSVEILERENGEAIQTAQEMRDIAKSLQQQLVVERSRTDRLLTYLKAWQRTSRHWIYESVFPQRDVILMTKTDANANTSETSEVDREDAEKIPDLQAFLQNSSETPGNVEETVLELTAPDEITYLGKVKGPANIGPESDSATVDKGKGKGKEVSYTSSPEDSNGKRKRGWSEKQAADALSMIERFALQHQVEASRRSMTEQTRHFDNPQASGSESSGGPSEPLHKRRKVASPLSGFLREGDTLTEESLHDIVNGPKRPTDPRFTTNTNSASSESRLRPTVGPRPSQMLRNEIPQASGSNRAPGDPATSGPMPRNKPRGLVRMETMIRGEQGWEPGPLHSQILGQKYLDDFVNGINRTIVGPPPHPINLSWASNGSPVIELPDRDLVPLREYITGIRRAVQFLQAGPPPGIKRFTNPGPTRTPLRRSHYPPFRWNFDGTPDINIPKGADPEKEKILIAAVKFLGDWAPWNENPPTADVVQPESGASAELEHDSSAARTLVADGLLCSWTSDGLPVITFSPDLLDEDQFHENILQASDFILRGPGPDDTWEASSELPARFRGSLPLDPMVVCTTDGFGSPQVRLPAPTCPSYCDRIVISANFIRDLRREKAAKEQMKQQVEATAYAKAAQLARELAEPDADDVDVEESRERAADEPVVVVEDQIEEQAEEQADEFETPAVEEHVDEGAEEEPVAKATKKTKRKATTTRKTTKKSGKKN